MTWAALHPVHRDRSHPLIAVEVRDDVIDGEHGAGEMRLVGEGHSWILSSQATS